MIFGKTNEETTEEMRLLGQKIIIDIYKDSKGDAKLAMLRIYTLAVLLTQFWFRHMDRKKERMNKFVAAVKLASEDAIRDTYGPNSPNKPEV